MNQFVPSIEANIKDDFKASLMYVRTLENYVGTRHFNGMLDKLYPDYDNVHYFETSVIMRQYMTSLRSLLRRHIRDGRYNMNESQSKYEKLGILLRYFTYRKLGMKASHRFVSRLIARGNSVTASNPIKERDASDTTFNDSVFGCRLPSRRRLIYVEGHEFETYMRGIRPTYDDMHGPVKDKDAYADLTRLKLKYISMYVRKMTHLRDRLKEDHPPLDHSGINTYFNALIQHAESWERTLRTFYDNSNLAMHGTMEDDHKDDEVDDILNGNMFAGLALQESVKKDMEDDGGKYLPGIETVFDVRDESPKRVPEGPVRERSPQKDWMTIDD